VAGIAAGPDEEVQIHVQVESPAGNVRADHVAVTDE
jgi:hypothetical protein